MTSQSVRIDLLFKDLYPSPGARIKQWVVEMRREDAWERTTCPHILTEVHNDNCGGECRNSGSASWMDLDHHDCCSSCNDLAEECTHRPEVAAWRALKAARPPITTDRDALSDEIASDVGMLDHPTLAATRRR